MGTALLLQETGNSSVLEFIRRQQKQGGRHPCYGAGKTNADISKHRGECKGHQCTENEFLNGREHGYESGSQALGCIAKNEDQPERYEEIGDDMQVLDCLPDNLLL